MQCLLNLYSTNNSKDFVFSGDLIKFKNGLLCPVLSKTDIKILGLEFFAKKGERFFGYGVMGLTFVSGHTTYISGKGPKISTLYLAESAINFSMSGGPNG